MPDHDIIANAYVALWNEADEAARLQTLKKEWTSEAVYTDPLMRAEGLENVSKMIGAVQSRFPKHRFQLFGVPDGYGSVVRFSWNLLTADDQHVVRGTDIARLDENRRIKDVIGFIENPPRTGDALNLDNPSTEKDA